MNKRRFLLYKEGSGLIIWSENDVVVKVWLDKKPEWIGKKLSEIKPEMIAKGIKAKEI